ncbi:hypothetical protein BDZ89DRAFT_732792 [Hymenopellis radicata]|nr:hypothetical protein BDZ89DRAFT_732792 [Hymenopellis radicata]
MYTQLLVAHFENSVPFCRRIPVPQSLRSDVAAILILHNPKYPRHFLNGCYIICNLTMNDGNAFPATFLNLVLSQEQSLNLGRTSLFASFRPITISFRLLNCLDLGVISNSSLNLKSKELTIILSITPGFIQRAYAALRCYALQLRTGSCIIDGSEYFLSRYPAKSCSTDSEITLAWVCGASSSPMGYIQYTSLEDSSGATYILITGLAVEASYRRHGYGRALVLSLIAGYSRM